MIAPVTSELVGNVMPVSPEQPIQESCVLCAQSLSHVRLFATSWTVACQAPLSMGFSRQDYWKGLPFPPPGDLPNPGIEAFSPEAPALAGGFFTTESPGKPLQLYFEDLCHKMMWSKAILRTC